MKPPTNKKWKFLAGRFNYSCDSNVANRAVTLKLIRTDGTGTVSTFWAPTLAADETGILVTGRPDPSADGSTETYLNTQIEVAGGMYLSFQSTNKQVGDTLTVTALIEETISLGE